MEGGGRYILTAAHVVGNLATGLAYPAANVSVIFNMPGGPITIIASAVTINPTWIPVTGQGGDIAVITLSAPAPVTAPRYDIYRNTDELFKTFTFYGYGESGVGDNRQGPRELSLRHAAPGWRTASRSWGPRWVTLPNVMAFDFDDGTATHDALGTLLGIHDTGLGSGIEANIAPGDSGGPAFINGLIAGVATFGVGATASDVDAATDFSFGKVSFETRVSDYATWIDQITSGGTTEILVNTVTAGMQRWSSVAMDENGDFVVTWTSYNQDVANGQNGVFAQRFDNTAAPDRRRVPGQFLQPEQPAASTVSMDADGDFTVAWESYQDSPQATDPSGVKATYGVFAQRYARAALIGTSTFIGVNGELGGQFEVNSTIAGDQRFPAVAMDHAGDFAIVWSGNGTVAGQADTQGVFYNRYQSTTDLAGPIVADTLRVQANPSTSNSLWLVRNGIFVGSAVPQMIVDFDENLWTKGGLTGDNSVLNLNNWEIDRGGIPMIGSIESVQFGLNQAYASGLETAPADKYQAVITFDSDPSTTAVEPLGGGDYTLTIHDAVWDLFRNRLDGNYDGLVGGDFQRTFSILSTIPGGPSNNVPVEPPGDPDPTAVNPVVPLAPVGVQDSPVVASDAAGNYVVVWVVYGQGSELLATDGNIVAQRFNSSGQRVGNQFTVNSVIAGSQIDPDVAMDAEGDFVDRVVRAGHGRPRHDQRRRHHHQHGRRLRPVLQQLRRAAGRVQGQRIHRRHPGPPRGGDGPERRLRGHLEQLQQSHRDARPLRRLGPPLQLPAAAPADVRADGSRQSRRGAQPRRAGQRASSTVQKDADVAMDGNGNFTIVWESDDSDGTAANVFGQQYNADGTTRGNPFEVNTYTSAGQIEPRIAMDPTGDFAVVWSSFVQDGSGYGVYARRYDAATAVLGTKFHVNENSAESNGLYTTNYWQYQPAVAMAANGRMVVTWSTDGQRLDAHDIDIHARIYDAGAQRRRRAAGSCEPGDRAPLGRVPHQRQPPQRPDRLPRGHGQRGELHHRLGRPRPDQRRHHRQRLLAHRQHRRYRRLDDHERFQCGRRLERRLVLGHHRRRRHHLADAHGNRGQRRAERHPRPHAQQLGSATQQRRAAGRRQRGPGRLQRQRRDRHGEHHRRPSAVKVEMWPDHTIVTGDGFELTTANTATINFTSVCRIDTIIFHAVGGDTFTFHGGGSSASLTGTGFALGVANVSTVTALATPGGGDVAQLYGSSAVNTFTATPTTP